MSEFNPDVLHGRALRRVHQLEAALSETTVALNSTRIIMHSKDARDLAGEIVARNNALLADSETGEQ